MAEKNGLRIPSFDKSLRGYTTEQVDTYIDYITEKYTQMREDYVAMKASLSSALEEIKQYKAEEQKRNQMIASAEIEAEAIVDTADKKASDILVDARKRAAGIVDEAKLKAETEKEASSFTVKEQLRIAIDMQSEFTELYGSIVGEYGRHMEKLEGLMKESEELIKTAAEDIDASIVPVDGGKYYSGERTAVNEDATVDDICEDDKTAEDEDTVTDGEADIMDGIPDLLTVDGDENRIEEELEEELPEPEDIGIDTTIRDDEESEDVSVDYSEGTQVNEFGESGDNIDLERLKHLYGIEAYSAEDKTADDGIDLGDSTEDSASKDFYPEGQEEYEDGEDINPLSYTAGEVKRRH